MADQDPKRIASQLVRVLPEATLGEFKFAPEFLAEEEAEPELSAERHEPIFGAANQIAIEKRLSGATRTSTHGSIFGVSEMERLPAKQLHRRRCNAFRTASTWPTTALNTSVSIYAATQI